LGLLLWQRKNQKFRGQIFFTFAFGYGFLRFLLEIIRDDVERGEYGPMLAEHILVPGALFLMAIGFCVGISLGIRDATMRTVARVLSFVPAVVAYLALKPPSFGSSVTVQLSTSQWIGFLTALTVSYFYAQYWAAARKSPALAMGLASLGPGAIGESDEEEEEEPASGADEGEEPLEHDAATAAEAPVPKRKRRKGEKALPTPPEDVSPEEAKT
jgi:phosphatidylglycerol:prolipoprotein diacylglycerol transferase